MASPRRILILTPWVPFPVTGACQQERFTGYKHLRDLGYELSIIAKIHPFQSHADAMSAFLAEHLPLQLVDHPRSVLPLLIKRFDSIVREPALFDGAALEYLDPVYERVVLDEVERFQPDVVWIEYSVLWPLLRLLRPYRLPTVIRSHNNEARNCIDEHGGSLMARLKALPKFRSERIAARESTVLAAITPDEAEWYRRCGGQHVFTLPLRGLAASFNHRVHREKDVLNVVFLSSNYNMRHNRDTMRFILHQVIPRVRVAAPGRFRFFFTGKKFPATDARFLADDVVASGFVPDLAAFLRTMDIALCPWITGQGMQQKVFEPLCCGLPLITTKTGGYPFISGEHVLLARTAEEIVTRLLEVQSPARRQTLANAAYLKAQELFSDTATQATMQQILRTAYDRRPQ